MQVLYIRGLHAQVKVGLVTLNNILGRVFIVEGFMPK